jgi:hypothetical protein
LYQCKVGFSIFCVGSIIEPARPVFGGDHASFLEEGPNRLNFYSSELGADLDDWRTPIMDYLSDPSAKVDESVQQLADNYILVNGDLY